MYGVDAVVSCKCKIGDCNTRNCNNCVCLSGGRPCGEECLCVGRCENRFNVFAFGKKKDQDDDESMCLA
jgi:hypothetical protein